MVDLQEELRVLRYPHNLSYQLKSFEKIPVELFNDSERGSKHIAHLISLAMILPSTGKGQILSSPSQKVGQHRTGVFPALPKTF